MTNFDFLKNEDRVELRVCIKKTRTGFLNYIRKNYSNVYYDELTFSLVTPSESSISSTSNVSIALKQFVAEDYKNIDGRVIVMQDDYEYIFRPNYSFRYFTLLVVFENHSKYNKAKLTHPTLFNDVLSVEEFS